MACPSLYRKDACIISDSTMYTSVQEHEIGFPQSFPKSGVNIVISFHKFILQNIKK